MFKKNRMDPIKSGRSHKKAGGGSVILRPGFVRICCFGVHIHGIV